MLGDLYTWEADKLDPRFFGHGVSRPRLYATVVRSFTRLTRSLTSLIGDLGTRTEQFDGLDFFRDDVEAPALLPSTLARPKDYEKMFPARTDMFDLHQNPRARPRRLLRDGALPVLTKTCLFFSTLAERAPTGLETVGIQGIPVFPDMLGFSEEVAAVFTQVCSIGLRCVGGNEMHLSCIGLVLCWALAYVDLPSSCISQPVSCRPSVPSNHVTSDPGRDSHCLANKVDGDLDIHPPPAAAQCFSEGPAPDGVSCGLFWWIQLQHGLLTLDLPFARHYRASVDGKHWGKRGSRRDLFPLPLMPKRADTDIHVDLGNVVVIGFNFLNAGCRSCARSLPPRVSLSVPHIAAHSGIMAKVQRLLERLNGITDVGLLSLSPESALAAFAAVATHLHPEFDPDLVDLAPDSGTCDPVASLNAASKSVVEDPALLFPQGAPQDLPNASCIRGSRRDYSGLTARLLRRRKIRLRVRCECAASVFVVGKRGGRKLREVWSGNHISAAARRPLAPPHLGNPGVFPRLYKRPGQRLFYKRSQDIFRPSPTTRQTQALFWTPYGAAT